MTKLLPFVIFGVDLDDAFIISGSYDRTDPKKEPEDRIHDTIEDIGISITLTTITSALAFGLGALSSIKPVYWMGYYAFPTILFVYIYQITFFVACIVLDERRVQQKRRDCCTCIMY
jgi:Niemann-Pick C1 protein